ncbi:IPTL-CTERM sorting domain-containing protein [Delftia sp. RIT313]|uniref:IPTL-CTERM sorting domain-containing protein n=1 Tax=Delftia sp. RIT313 TaxID=1468410 RepID=UPI0005C1CCF5|nr:IPTL-CTERM sorting domain-containing protein [Delftia sp. RIT313]
MHGSAQARQIQHALQGMSVPFEANSGQFDPAVAFTGRTFAGAIHVTRQGQIVYSLAAPTQQQGVTSAPPPEMPPQAPPKKPPRTPAGTKPQAPPQTPPATQPLSGWSLTETLAGALPLSPTGGEAAATQITRFSGPHSYQPANYRNLHLGQAWPGVQVELAVRGANVEKLFHVAPQADPGQIQVRVDGALSLRLGKGGELIAATGHGDVAYTAPVAFQEVAGRRVEVPVQYALNSRGDGYGFALGAYDRALPLVIDPFLQSTYLGGSNYDVITALVVTPSGQVLVAGRTESSDFPGTAGGAQPSSGTSNLFVARLSGDLRTLEQSTYLGDGGIPRSMAILPSGDVVVGGTIWSGNLPGTENGAQPAKPASGSGFVTRLSADLRAVSPQAITFPPQADQVLTATGDTFQISPIATANSGLAVNYTAHTPAVCTVSGTTVTMVDAGPCMLEAWLPSVPGQWLAANGIFVTLQIRRPQVISFPAQADQPFTAGASFDLGPPATATSNLPVDYASTTPGVCTVSGATVTMVSAGICRVTASQPGNTLWLAATDVSQDIELVASTVSPPSPLPPPPPPAPGPGPGAASPVPVPTLGPWALAWLGTLAAGLGAISLRRRARHSSAR